jgi:endonuclease/exonuclease/phosphatase (EEP) superfamily protein YafD
MAEVVFPANDKKKKPDNCTRADIEIAGSVVRVYNCQFPIFRVGPSERKRLLHYILQDAAKHQGPTIICGDLNTTIPAPGFKRTIIQNWHMEPNAELEIAGTFMHRDERFLVHDTITKHGFVEALDLHIPTWSGLKTKLWELFHLKLDWFMVKNLTVVSTALGDYVSDHKAIEVRCAFTDTK